MDVILIQHIDQLRECRCDPRTALVLNTLHTLLHNFLDDQCKVITGASLRNFIKIHENRYKWCLSVTGHKSDQLVLDRLDTTLDFILQSRSDTFWMISSSRGSPQALRSSITLLRIFWRLMSTKGARWAREKDCPPY